MSSTIRRAKKDADNPYRAVRRATFEDERLSWEARGLLAYLLVKPDDWRINVANLVNQAPGGRDRVYRIINELIEFGYICRDEIRTNGKIAGYDYTVYEEPRTEKPEQIPLLPNEPDTENTDTELPLPEKPYPVLPYTANTHISNKEVVVSNKTDAEPTAPHRQQKNSDADIKAAEEKERRSALKTTWLSVSEAKNYSPVQVNKGIMLLERADCTPDELKALYEWMAGDTFWEGKNIYPQSMLKKIDEFRRVRERRINTNGHHPTVQGVVDIEASAL